MCPNTHGEAVNLQRQFDPRRLPVILDHAHGDGRCGALDASAFVFDAGRRALGSKECPHIVPEPWRANPVRSRPILTPSTGLCFWRDRAALGTSAGDPLRKAGAAELAVAAGDGGE
jgi:hypothetical protein